MASFGLPTSTFGQATSQQTGGLTLGGFGTQPSATTAASGFNFGGGSTGFGGFGTNPATTTTTSSGGMGGFADFGLPAAKVAATAASTGFQFGGFGTTPTTATSGFGLGTGFGTTTTTSASGIGAPGTGFGFGGFGTTTSAPASSGFNFGGGLTTGIGTTLGANQSGSGMFGKPMVGMTTLGPAPSAIGVSPFSADASLSNLTAALCCPVLYGDERDTIVAKWNQLQAFWGTGKGFYSISAPPIEFTPNNPFCKFKAVGYSCLPTSKNEDGFVSLIINRKDVEVRAQQHQLVEGLQRLLGSRPTLLACVEGVKPALDNKSEVTIYILERSHTGVSRRIPTSEVFTYFSQANVRQQMATLGIETVVPKAAPTAEQLSYYMDNPPSGIDPLLWQQARLDNPDPERLIPVPMVGFAELQRRLKCQDEETKVHQGRLNVIIGEINNLQHNHSNTVAKISEQKRRHLELSRRILKVMVRQEIGRKLGLAIQADEEQLRVQLEAINNELSAPNQAKGRLNELMSQIRLQREHMLAHTIERYAIDPALQTELKQHLRVQQEGISHLVAVVREDLECLKIIEGGLSGESRQRK